MVCKECQKEFDSLSSLRRHRSLVHKISSENTYIEYVLGGANPESVVLRLKAELGL